MLGFSGTVRVAHAQDEPEPENPRGSGRAWFRMTDEQFEQWIFGKSIGAARG